MQKPLTMIAIIAVASTGIGYGLGNSGSHIPPVQTEQVYVAPVSRSDSSDHRFAESRAQLQHAKRSAAEACGAADKVAVAARWQWFENGCVEDLIRVTAADDAHDSAEESLSKPEKILLSELR